MSLFLRYLEQVVAQMKTQYMIALVIIAVMYGHHHHRLLLYTHKDRLFQLQRMICSPSNASEAQRVSGTSCP